MLGGAVRENRRSLSISRIPCHNGNKAIQSLNAEGAHARFTTTIETLAGIWVSSNQKTRRAPFMASRVRSFSLVPVVVFLHRQPEHHKPNTGRSLFPNPRSSPRSRANPRSFALLRFVRTLGALRDLEQMIVLNGVAHRRRELSRIPKPWTSNRSVSLQIFHLRWRKVLCGTGWELSLCPEYDSFLDRHRFRKIAHILPKEIIGSVLDTHVCEITREITPKLLSSLKMGKLCG